MNINIDKLHCLIDLHVHLDGSVSIPMAKRLALINGIELNESEEDLKERLQVSKDCRDLNEYLEKFDRLMNRTDLFLLDIKAVDGKLHKELTGQPNDNILAMAHYLADHGKSMWIRHVLVPGLTDSEEDLLALRDLERSLPTLKRVEVLPYHTLGLFKWKKLGITYSLNGVPTPTEEEVRRAEEILEVHKYYLTSLFTSTKDESYTTPNGRYPPPHIVCCAVIVRFI